MLSVSTWPSRIKTRLERKRGLLAHPLTPCSFFNIWIAYLSSVLNEPPQKLNNNIQQNKAEAINHTLGMRNRNTNKYTCSTSSRIGRGGGSGVCESHLLSIYFLVKQKCKYLFFPNLNSKFSKIILVTLRSRSRGDLSKCSGDNILIALMKKNIKVFLDLV